MRHVFDPRTVLLARHAQHVVLIHFPIALFLAAAGFDLAASWTRRRDLAIAAYWNLTAAALFTLPAVATGLLAWQLALDGRPPRGVLLYHMVGGLAATGMIWAVWWTWRRAESGAGPLPRHRWALELAAALVVAATAHLGGYLSGVNVP